VRVESAGLLVGGSSERLAMFGDLHTLPRTLAEGETIKLQALMSNVAANSVLAGRGEITYGYVVDSLGRTYKAQVPAAVRLQVADAARLAPE
jgi:hypothetical protein